MNLKLVDFGLSNTYYNDELLQTPCGSPCYAAPEMLQNKQYRGDEVDVWSSGVVLFAMICGYLPFEHDDNKQLQHIITTSKYELPSHVSYDAAKILSNIFNTIPQNRITFKQIRKTAFYHLHDTKKLNPYSGIDCMNQIPRLSNDILERMKSKGYDYGKLVENLVNNKHNIFTTYYYLTCMSEDEPIYEPLMSKNVFIELARDVRLIDIDFSQGCIKETARQ